MASSEMSIVEYFAEHEGYRCGYCKQEDTNYSHGMWAHVLTTQDYQDLIDRGWRRSGQYLYKPTMAKTCCPLYTIKCDVLNFKLSKSQKKVMKKFNNFLMCGQGKKDGNTKDMEEVVESVVEDVENDKGRKLEKELRLSNVDEILSKNGIITNNLHSKGETVQSSSSIVTHIPEIKSTNHVKSVNLHDNQSTKNVTPGVGMDPDKPRRGKAKDERRRRREEKQTERQMTSHSSSDSGEKSVDSWLTVGSGQESSPFHKFTRRLVPADEDDPEFMSSFQESLTVYQKYQSIIHDDPPDKCGAGQFKRFLCKSPLVSQDGHGSFHYQYLLDGKIIAVGVIDILPHSVSSVYLYYDPEYRFLSLGTLTSLLEIEMVRSLARTTKINITNYYLGFYIHSCVKMRYKGRYSPSYLACPETYSWQPLANCIPLLDKSPYSRLDPSHPQTEEKINLSQVGVLYSRRAVTFEFFLSLKEQEGDDVDQDKEEVKEYAGLVGETIAKRMLLYRPS